MTKVSVDLSQVRDLVVDMRQAAGRLRKEVPEKVAASSARIERQMRDDMRASKSFGQIASAITTSPILAGFGAEIGPRKGKPGSLANIAYFPTAVSVYRGGRGWRMEVRRGPGAGGGTVADPRTVLEAEAPNFRKSLLEAAARSVLS